MKFLLAGIVVLAYLVPNNMKLWCKISASVVTKFTEFSWHQLLIQERQSSFTSNWFAVSQAHTIINLSVAKQIYRNLINNSVGILSEHGFWHIKVEIHVKVIDYLFLLDTDKKSKQPSHIPSKIKNNCYLFSYILCRVFVILMASVASINASGLIGRFLVNH